MQNISTVLESLSFYLESIQPFEFLVSLNPRFIPDQFFSIGNDSSLKKSSRSRCSRIYRPVDSTTFPTREQRALYSRYEGHRCRLSSHYQANLPVLLQIHRLRFDQANKPTSLLPLFFLPFHTLVNFPSPIQAQQGFRESAKIYAANTDLPTDYSS